MRRLLFSSLAAGLFALVMVPGLVQAADPAPAEGSGLRNGDCVQTGVGITGKTAQCIPNNPSNGGAIVLYLKYILQFLSTGVGLVVLLMLVIAGVQYITSAGDPGLVKAAKDRIVNAITALMLFILSFAILNFIIPGGIL